jgi:drug/metabolite transporter (DMT)-like permease
MAKDATEKGRAGDPFGMALAALSAATFGVGTTLARLAYDGGSTPFTVVLLRTAAFVLLVGAPLALIGRDLRINRRTLLATLWMAVTLGVVALGYQGSVAFIPVSLAALVFYSFPLLVALIAAAAGRDRLTMRSGGALVTAFAGLALTLGPGLASLDWRGIALAIMAALGMALTLSFGGEATRAKDPMVMSVYTNVWMLLAFGLLALTGGGLSPPRTAIGLSAATGVCLSYVIAYVCWYTALGLVRPVRLAALFNIEPVVTLFVAWLVLGERLSAVQLAGAALVLASVAAATLRPSGGRRSADR